MSNWRAVCTTVERSIVGAHHTAYAPPMFYQATIFRYLLAAVAIGLLWIAYLWRVHTVSIRVEKRILESLSDRDRIVRELQDTLLQGFQALLHRMGIVTRGLPADEPVRKRMEDALDRAQEVLIDGRDRIKDLRATHGSGKMFDKQMTDICEKLRLDANSHISCESTGTPRPLQDLACEELCLICKEALTNALQHSGATKIRLSVLFAEDYLTIICIDNGRGIEESTLENGPVDHWGISGMRERAQQLGAHLTIRSTENRGTKIIVQLTAKRAYAFEHPSFIQQIKDDVVRRYNRALHVK